MAMEDNRRGFGQRLPSPSAIAEKHRHPNNVTQFPETDKPPPKQSQADDGPEPFDPESTDYKAYGRSVNKTVPSLRIILKDGSEWMIAYAHLDSHPKKGCRFLPTTPDGKCNRIVLRVAGNDAAGEVEIDGIRLRMVWEMIALHLTPWICERPAGEVFVSDNEPVINSITPKLEAASTAR